MRPRLKYFDMMKGLAIFLVVMGNVLTMCVREIDRAPVFKFIGQIHMPLFFFISGWFAVKIGSDGLLKTPGLLSRAKRLLLPMLGASTLFIYYYPHSGLQSPFDSTWSGLWLNVWKNGYWFTFVLFEIFAVYAALTFVLRRMASFWLELLAVAVAWAVLG
ncbi:MAG: acyltransferase family protein, partial [Muribaculaceae bacterium]|nr:acyltransferase family protein [Muribaculaceae bacterium]